MTNHQRKVRPHATPKPKQEPKARPVRVNYYLANKLAALKYDYGLIMPELRAQVQEAAFEIQRWQRSTVEVGKTLLTIKELLPHRQFLDWLMTEFGLKERSVQSMMNVARIYGEPEKAQRVALLSAGALYELAAPSTPATARTVIEERIAAGEIPTRAEVKQVIDEHKPGTPRVKPPEPEPAIEASYTVITEPPTFAEWLAAMPTDLSLREQLAILALAKTTALRALGDHPKLYNAVYGALPAWSQLITAIEKELKR